MHVGRNSLYIPVHMWLWREIMESCNPSPSPSSTCPPRWGAIVAVGRTQAARPNHLFLVCFFFSCFSFFFFFFIEVYPRIHKWLKKKISCPSRYLERVPRGTCFAGDAFLLHTYMVSLGTRARHTPRRCVGLRVRTETHVSKHNKCAVSYTTNLGDYLTIRLRARMTLYVHKGPGTNLGPRKCCCLEASTTPTACGSEVS